MKVICINTEIIDKYNPYNDSLSKLNFFELYTVIEVIDPGTFEESYLLEEVKSSSPSGAFNSKRFALAGEFNKVNIEFEDIESKYDIDEIIKILNT